MMDVKLILLFLLTLNSVKGNNCGFKNLGELFDGSFDQCTTEERWSIAPESMTTDKTAEITSFLTPSSARSCITSHPLFMSGGGKIEVNVYAKSITKGDYVTVLVYEAMKNNVVGQATLSSEGMNIVNGKNTLKIDLNNVKIPVGYIMLVGAASENSVIQVESVCYESPLQANRGVTKLTSNVRAPDIFVLQSDSVLKAQIHPKDDTENIAVKETHVSNEITVNSAMRFIDFEDFWTPLTISLAVIIPVLILVLLGWGCYALGKRRGSKQEPEIIYEDVNQIPKPYLVPRVKSVYTESVAGSAYGERSNNVYSV